MNRHSYPSPPQTVQEARDRYGMKMNSWFPLGNPSICDLDPGFCYFEFPKERTQRNTTYRIGWQELHDRKKGNPPDLDLLKVA